MITTEERELLTILSEDEHKKVLSSLKSKFGKPEVQKRLSLQSDDYGQNKIDTRIRITNDKAELIQKVGDWKNIAKGKSRTEIVLPLPSDANTILIMFKIIRNLTQGKTVENIIMQFENYVWKNKNYEIKLTHQFGLGSGYNCEVEVFNKRMSPTKLTTELQIPIHLPTEKKDFWRKWNKTVNLSVNTLSEKQLLKIIQGYL